MPIVTPEDIRDHKPEYSPQETLELLTGYLMQLTKPPSSATIQVIAELARMMPESHDKIVEGDYGRFGIACNLTFLAFKDDLNATDGGKLSNLGLGAQMGALAMREATLSE